MEPVMMAIDLLAALINQKHLIKCIERLERIDYKLSKENITVNYRPLQRLSVILLILLVLRIVAMTILSIFWYELNVFQLWCVYMPIFLTALAKIWFVLLVSNIRAKYQAINSYLDELGDKLKEDKEKSEKFSATSRDTNRGNETLNRRSSTTKEGNPSAERMDVGYLHKEIIVNTKTRDFNMSRRPTVTFVKPTDAPEVDTPPVNNQAPVDLSNATENDEELFPKNGKIGDKFDQRLTNLCSIHDEICTVWLLKLTLFFIYE